MKAKSCTTVDKSILELVSLSNLESPFASQLLDRYREKLVRRLLQAGKISYDDAKQLCQRLKVKKVGGGSGYFLVN